MPRDWEVVRQWLKEQHILGAPLSQDDFEQLSQRWLEKYCANVKAQTGEWIYLGFRWHAYSYGFEAAIDGEEALSRYLEQDVSQYLILFEHDRLIFDCHGPPSVLRNVGDDLYVFPYDLSWTMIFTHEDVLGLGPYFAVPSHS